MKRIVTLLLFAALLTSISCGGTGNHAETDDITTSDAPVIPEPDYVYPQLDLGEREFTILNTAQNYNLCFSAKAPDFYRVLFSVTRRQKASFIQ